MKAFKNIAAFMLVALLVCSLLLNVRHYTRATKIETVRDTTRVTIYDTLTYYKPVPRDSVVVRYITEVLPVADTAGSNVAENIPQDSANVVIPITQRVYEDSTYTAYVSGYRASLDSILVYPRLEVVTINNTHTEVSRQKRWGIGVQVGYGITVNGTPQFSPYIGVGISYNILNF